MRVCHAIFEFTLPSREKIVAKLVVGAASNRDMAALRLGYVDVANKRVDLSRRGSIHLHLHISSIERLSSFDIHENLDIREVCTRCDLQPSRVYAAYMNALRKLGHIRQPEYLVARKRVVNIRCTDIPGYL